MHIECVLPCWKLVNGWCGLPSKLIERKCEERAMEIIYNTQDCCRMTEQAARIKCRHLVFIDLFKIIHRHQRLTCYILAYSYRFWSGFFLRFRRGLFLVCFSDILMIRHARITKRTSMSSQIDYLDTDID